MRVSRLRSAGNLRTRYAAYACDHGMTPEQIRGLDRSCYPDAMLTPFFLWLSGKKLEWLRLNPERTLQSGKDYVDFERWLEQLEPKSNALTCECHGKYTSPR
jgi:hypothetical protein